MGVGVQVESPGPGGPIHPPALGVVVGQGQTGLLSLKYLSEEDVVLEGDRVVTSGQGAIFPRGLPVGQIVGYPQQAGVVEPVEADVRPFVDRLRLREVYVVHNPEPVAEGEGGRD